MEIRRHIGPVAATLGLGLLVLAALPFVLHSVGRGFALFDPVERAASRFVSLDGAATGALYAHMVLGGLLTGLAPLQLLGGVRRRWPRLHHANGYVVGTLAGLTGALGLVYIARQGTIGGPLMSAGFAVYGLLLALAAVQTLRFARARDHRHAGWAGRLIVLALASWFFRVQYGLWSLAFGEWGTAPDFSGAFDRAMTFGFYLPWLAVYEVVRAIRGRRPVAGLTRRT